MRNKGFTLLELIVVIIIIGILATIGFGQYTKVIEKGRTAEAKSILGSLRSADTAYNLQYGSYAAAVGDLPIGAGACDTDHYFGYAAASGVYTATRCSSGGKPPQGPATAYTITLNSSGAWGGSAGYY